MVERELAALTPGEKRSALRILIATIKGPSSLGRWEHLYKKENQLHGRGIETAIRILRKLRSADRS